MNGSASCTDRGCSGSGTHCCAYTDQNGTSCPTAWCDRHIRFYGAEKYCRRHASTMAALKAMPPVNGEPQPVPLIGNRVPSLVRWVAREVDERIRDLLLVQAGPDGTVDARGATSVATGTGRRWMWRWIGYSPDHTSVADVTISVDEARESVVSVHANHEPVFSDSPPWISRERGGGTVSAAERQAYAEQIVAMVAAAFGQVGANPQR